MNQAKQSFDVAKISLSARMDSIVGGATTDTEILDARVDADNTEYANLAARLKATDQQMIDASSETLDGSRRSSLAVYIRDEWRTDCNLLRGNGLYKGTVNISGLHNGDSMENAIDPTGDGYYLIINAKDLHKAGLNVLFTGDMNPRTIMRGQYGGSEDDWRFGGYLQCPYQPHFTVLDNGAKMLNTAGSAWNHVVAHYLYINLTEEQITANQIMICDTEGIPIQNCLTELLDRVEHYEDRRDEQRNGVTVDTVNAKIAEVKSELQTETDEKIEDAINGIASFWKGKTINFIGDSITYGAYTPVGGGSHQRAENVTAKWPARFSVQPVVTMALLAQVFPARRIKPQRQRFPDAIRRWTMMRIWLWLWAERMITGQTLLWGVSQIRRTFRFMVL
jgi:hypothetical protein